MRPFDVAGPTCNSSLSCPFKYPGSFVWSTLGATCFPRGFQHTQRTFWLCLTFRFASRYWNFVASCAKTPPYAPPPLASPALCPAAGVP